MGISFPLFGSIEHYNPANAQHFRSLCAIIQGRVFRIWFREPAQTMVEAMPIYEQLVGWFQAAKFDDYIPLADFEAAVMDALRDQLAADREFTASCQLQFGNS